MTTPLGPLLAQRTKELGIRVALGAQKVRVLRSVIASGARLAVLGILLGIGLTR